MASDLPPGPKAAAAPHVLLLDDDPFTLDMLADMLGELGVHEVVRETDARRALERMQERAFDLLICDLSMPDMDGIELLEAAGAARFRGRVMLLSGVDDSVRKAAEVLGRAHGLDVVGAWAKPISLTDLAAAIGAAGGARA
jgi:CheY-like chemotaxis protein